MHDRPNSRWQFLRLADQVAVAACVVVALGAIAGWWLRHGGRQGDVIEIDRADPLVARFEVDINTADWPELMQLPNIGSTLAHRIVDYRAKSGPFRDHEDLRRVRGLGPKTLEQIRPYLQAMPDRRALGGMPSGSSTKELVN
jgi:competence protein ComEA